MPNGVRNWSYRDVTDFLKERGFEYKENRKGSHEAWVNFETNKIVEINISKAYPPKTLQTMIRQSGIEQKEWVKWAGQ